MQMWSTHVAQIVKAQWFIAEPCRFESVDQDTFVLTGHRATHVLVRRGDGSWRCDCAYARQGVTPYADARALEKLLDDGAFGPADVETRSLCESDQREASLRLQIYISQVAKEVC